MKTLEEIYSQFSQNRDCGHGDKGTTHSYIESYDRLLSPYRDKKINFLEIGLAYGESLEMWWEYFGGMDSKASIYGVDRTSSQIYSDKFKEGGYKNDGRFTIWINDATTPAFRNQIEDMKLDVVIDDGSHRFSDQVGTFTLLKNCMNKGGIYIIEDVANLGPDSIPAFESLHDNIEIIDLRNVKNRYDDVLIVYKF